MSTLRNRWIVPVVLGLALNIAADVTRSSADEGKKSVTLEFSTPTQIPGRVLRPGSYILETAGGDSGWNVVRVYTADRTSLVTTLLAYPNPQLPADGRKVLLYTRGISSGAQVMEGWYFDGDTLAEQWAYPKSEADRIGRANHTRIPTTGTSDVYPSTLPLAASSWSAPVTEDAASAPQSVENVSAKTADPTPARRLPKTASYRPLAGLLGLLALAGGLLMRKFAPAAAGTAR